MRRRVGARETLDPGDRIAGIVAGLERPAQTLREVRTRREHEVGLPAADVEAAGRRHVLRAGDQAVGDAREPRAQVRGERIGAHAGTR